MRTKSELFWELVHQLWIIAAYCFVMYAIWRKEWAEATFWLVWIAFDRMPKKEGA
jgi:hypothetical protein